MSADMSARITFISAGAGSGKTHRLTEILHRELAAGEVRPSGVIATTFTRKAATELRERVRGHLLQQADFALANAMGEARIGTVNSVCGQLIERFAFEAGLATEQQVLEEGPAGALLGKAIDVVLDGPSMSAFLTVVRRLGLDDNWKRDLQRLVDLVRANDIPVHRIAAFAQTNADDLLSHFPAPAKEDLTAMLAGAIHGLLPTIEQAAAVSGKKNTQNYLAQLRTLDRALSGGSAGWGDWVKLSKLWPEAALKRLAEPVNELAARVAEHPALHADVRAYLVRIFDLAARALAVYGRSKEELCVLDFADQELLLLKLLDHPGVGEVLAEELDLLMVDEFQDTSPIQLALFLKLARFAKRAYWVGDIKQAIYGFRGSDTALMQSVLEALPALGGSKEILRFSWRSRPELVELVNAIFAHAFRASLAEAEVVLEAKRKEPLPGAPLANWILGGRNIGQEASALAAGLRRLVATRYQVIDKGAATGRDVRFGDIAILSPTNDGVKAIAAALREGGIPSATAQPGLLSTPEATLALACLRRLNDPGDTVATAEIVSLADCAEPEAWLSDRLRYLESGASADAWLENDAGVQPAHPLMARIAALRASLPVLAPREALQSVLAACELPARIVRWSRDAELARVRLANLEALLDLARQYEDLCRSGQHAASISGLILWLNEAAGQGQDMLAEPAIDAVKVMTCHTAKGLEWPVVVLTDLADDVKDRLWSISAQSTQPLDVRCPLDGRFLRYWPWPFGKQRRVPVTDRIALTPLAASFRQSAIEEAKRLLYVSMTRARDLLVLARSARKPSGEWIDSIESPWLLHEEGAQAITLPSGERVSTELWQLDPEQDGAGRMPSPQASLHWFAPAPALAPRLPLAFVPSAAEGRAFQAAEKCAVGEAVAIARGADMNALGTAIHACLAVSFTDARRPISLPEVERLLEAFGVAGQLSSTALLRQTQALHAWIAARWPGARALAEYPVQSLLASGQILQGRIDLLLDTGSAWVLIDHKSAVSAPERWDPLAQEHGAQLAAYADAILAASGRAVSEAWLFLPLAGGALRVAPDAAAGAGRSADPHSDELAWSA